MAVIRDDDEQLTDPLPQRESIISSGFGYVTAQDKARWAAQGKLAAAEKNGTSLRRALNGSARGGEDFAERVLDIEIIARQVQLAGGERDEPAEPEALPAPELEQDEEAQL